MAGDFEIERRTEAWVTEGIIDSAQAAGIIAHEHRAEQSAGRRSQLPAVFGVLGGLLVGLGVILTVAANWQELSDTVKLGTLVMSMSAAYLAGLIADGRQAPRWAGSTAYLVGILTFAAGLFLIGQIYNVRAHDPLGFLVVAVTATLLALLVERMTIGFVAAVAWLAWGVHEIIASLDSAVDEQVVIAAIGSMTLLGIAALGAGWALEGVGRRVGAGDRTGPVTLLARAEVVTLPLRIAALLGLLGVLTAASFAWHMDADAEARMLAGPVGLSGALALTTAALTGLLAPLGHRRIVGAALALSAVAVLLVIVIQDDLLAALLANLLLGAGGAGLVTLGLTERHPTLFVLGIAWLAMLIVARYLDFITSVAWGGLSFVGAGVLLIAIAWLASRSRSLWQRHLDTEVVS